MRSVFKSSLLVMTAIVALLTLTLWSVAGQAAPNAAYGEPTASPYSGCPDPRGPCGGEALCRELCSTVQQRYVLEETTETLTSIKCSDTCNGTKYTRLTERFQCYDWFCAAAGQEPSTRCYQAPEWEVFIQYDCTTNCGDDCPGLYPHCGEWGCACWYYFWGPDREFCLDVYMPNLCCS
jgi:hypothetical protein